MPSSKPCAGNLVRLTLSTYNKHHPAISRRRHLDTLLMAVLGANFLAGCVGTHALWLHPEIAQKQTICLTFDDGPNGVATTRILEVLRRYHVQATFFLIGKNVERNPTLARRIVEEGHFVGGHSYGHENLLAFQSAKHIRQNLEKTNQLIRDATGVSPRYFRPPNGLMTTRLQQICDELGLTPVGVHIFIHDSFMTNPKHIATQVLRRIRGGAYIIVLHDGFGTLNAPSRTVVAEALERLIPELNDRGYRWVSPDRILTAAL